MPTSSGPSRPAGPIKTLKRTFSSGGTVLTAGLSANASSSNGSRSNTLAATKNLAAAAPPKLPPSAYNFEFDDDDEDWQMDLDLSANASSTSRNSSAVSSTSSCNTSVSSKASSVASTPNLTNSKPVFAGATGIAGSIGTSAPPRSPPRAPQPFKLPSIPNKGADLTSSCSLPTTSLPPAATQVVNIPSLPRVDPRNTDAANTSASRTSTVESLTSKALRAPFSSKSKKDEGQTKLSGFFEASSDDKKRLCPWDEAAAGPSKVPRASSATPSDGGKGKGKSTGNGIGPLNVKQQIMLSAEQQKVLTMVTKERKSVFFTGSAGTGKSILLREIIASLRKTYASRGADRVAITASTGMAAANIGGTTIHSFSGIGLGQGTGEQLIDTVKKNKKATGRWLRTEVLIIDEVSMLDGDLFDKLEHIARRFRKKPDKPFGGIQLIITGDFFQLPPVTKGMMPKFAFEAKAWKDCIQATVNLKKVFRQKDGEFIEMLNEMRFGKLSQASIVKFGKLKRVPKYTDGIEPTELFPLREQVDSANRQRLAALEGEEMTFRSADDGEEKGDRLLKTLENVMAPQVLTLKLGAQVMLLKNMDNGLVNGSVGKVVAFKSKGEMLEDEDENDDFAQLIKTKNKWKREFSREPSAAPSATGDDDEEGEGAGTKGPVKKVKSAAYEEKCPVVEWKMPGGGTLTMRMVREEFVVEDVGNKVKARRRQFPMICAWAMSIHKSQGQTLERVKCDLGRIFEKGQAYVALSRATSLDGLQVLNFNPAKVLAHPKVVAWTNGLQTFD